MLIAPTPWFEEKVVEGLSEAIRKGTDRVRDDLKLDQSESGFRERIKAHDSEIRSRFGKSYHHYVCNGVSALTYLFPDLKLEALCAKDLQQLIGFRLDGRHVLYVRRDGFHARGTQVELPWSTGSDEPDSETTSEMSSGTVTYLSMRLRWPRSLTRSPLELQPRFARLELIGAGGSTVHQVNLLNPPATTEAPPPQRPDMEDDGGSETESERQEKNIS